MNKFTIRAKAKSCFLRTCPNININAVYNKSSFDCRIPFLRNYKPTDSDSGFIQDCNSRLKTQQLNRRFRYINILVYLYILRYAIYVLTYDVFVFCVTVRVHFERTWITYMYVCCSNANRRDTINVTEFDLLQRSCRCRTI